MKKILCLLAVLPILATGCGSTAKVVLDSTGGEYYAPKVSDDISEKVKPTDEASADSDDQAKPPKVKVDSGDDNDGAVSVNDGEQPSENSSGEENSPAQSPENGENSDDNADDTYKYHLDGIVLETKENSILISEIDLKRIELKCTAEQISQLQPGDGVTVKYDGILGETYPMQGEAHSIEVTRKAEKKYEMKRFNYRDLFFSVMVPEDWNDRTIDYPQEGDFTDWGIRLQPSGAKGNLDISWHSAFAIRDPYDKRRMKLNGYNIVEYSKSGAWKFIEYSDKSYIINNNFDNSGEFDKYKVDIDIIKNTLEFV